MHSSWTKLSDLSKAKKARLDDDLAREQFNDKLRGWNASHNDGYVKLKAFIETSEAYLNTEEKSACSICLCH